MSDPLWMEFISTRTFDGVPSGLCGLCGNHGVIDTRGKVHSPAGCECGVLAWCICPNGRAAKRAGWDLEARSRVR